MGMSTSGAFLVTRSEPRTRTALLVEAIALHHQIAVLEHSETRLPCFIIVTNGIVYFGSCSRAGGPNGATA